MAEFQEVMRQWVRARKATCGITGEYENLSNLSLNLWNDECIAQLEKEVMQWAAEHPEPVYPTWEEWLEEVGFVKKTIMKDFIHREYCWKEHISPDIAEKLGLQPKEAKYSANE